MPVSNPTDLASPPAYGSTTPNAVRGYRPSTQITATRSLSATDTNKHLWSNDANAIVLTIPVSTIATDSEIEVAVIGSGSITITPASGVTINGSTASVVAQLNQPLFLRFYGTNTVAAFGSGTVTTSVDWTNPGAIGATTPNTGVFIGVRSPSFQIKNGAFSSTVTSPASVNRAVVFPDKDGTIAFTSDISASSTDWANPGAIGSTAANSGAFTSLSSTGIYVNTNTTAATSTTTGAHRVAGGLGVGGEAWIGGLINGSIKFFKSAIAGVSTVVQAEDDTSTNINLVLQPKGTGAIVAGATPDSTAIGGNARGLNALDLQTARSSRFQIAAGAGSVLLGGTNNTAAESNAIVLAGNDNSASTYNTTIIGGAYNYAAGFSSVILGGYGCATYGSYSLAGGRSAVTNLYGQIVSASGGFSSAGDAQTSVLVARNSTNNATQTELFLDGSSERIKLNNNASLTYFISVNAHSVTDRTKQAAFFRRGKIYRLATFGSTAKVGGEIAENIVAALPWTVAISADTTNGALRISVMGDITNTINWVARIELTETFG